MFGYLSLKARRKFKVTYAIVVENNKSSCSIPTLFCRKQRLNGVNSLIDIEIDGHC